MFFTKSRLADDTAARNDRIESHRHYLRLLALTSLFVTELSEKHALRIVPVHSFDPQGRFVVKMQPMAFTPTEKTRWVSYVLWLSSDLYSGFAFQESAAHEADKIDKFHFSGSGMSDEMFVRAQVLQTAHTLNNLLFLNKA